MAKRNSVSSSKKNKSPVQWIASFLKTPSSLTDRTTIITTISTIKSGKNPMTPIIQSPISFLCRTSCKTERNTAKKCCPAALGRINHIVLQNKEGWDMIKNVKK